MISFFYKLVKFLDGAVNSMNQQCHRIVESFDHI